MKAALVLAFLIGCGGGAAAPKKAEPVEAAKPAPVETAPADPADRILAGMRGWKDQVCACTDGPCVAKAEQKMQEWATEHLDEINALQPLRESAAAIPCKI